MSCRMGRLSDVYQTSHLSVQLSVYPLHCPFAHSVECVTSLAKDDDDDDNDDVIYNGHTFPSNPFPHHVLAHTMCAHSKIVKVPKTTGTDRGVNGELSLTAMQDANG